MRRHEDAMIMLRENRNVEIKKANDAFCVEHGLDSDLTRVDTFELIAWLWKKLEENENRCNK